MSQVSIVLISHSKDLVQGLKALLQQFQPEVNVSCAGGTDDEEIGTSALKIKRSIEEVMTDAGVIVLFDIGSAKMNADLAIEMMGHPKKVAMADAPLVEGAIASVVEAGMGNSLEDVVKSAEEAKGMIKTE